MTIPCLRFSVLTRRRDLKGHENPMEVSIQLRSTNKQTDNANKVTNPELFKKLGEKNLSQVKSTRNLFYIMTWMKNCAKPQMTKFKNLSYVSNVVMSLTILYTKLLGHWVLNTCLEKLQ